MLPVKGYTKICFGILFAIASFVGCISQKKLYKERKSLWIYQIFKDFETFVSLSNVFVKDRYYKNPIEFIFGLIFSN